MTDDNNTCECDSTSACTQIALLWTPYVVMFYSCDLLFIYLFIYLFIDYYYFHALIFEVEERRPTGPLPDVGMRWGVIL